MKIWCYLLLLMINFNAFSQKPIIPKPPDNPMKDKIDSVHNAAISDFNKGILDFYVDEACEVDDVDCFSCYHNYIVKKTGVTFKYYPNCGMAFSLDKEFYIDKMNQLILAKYGSSFYKKWNKKAIKYCKKKQKLKTS